MKNELQKHKKSDGFKWFCTLLAVLMLAVAVTAAITQGFKNWNPYGWFDKKEEQPLPDENGGGPVTDENGNEMNGGEVHEMPKQMTFRSVAALDGESAYDSVTLHATVKPDDTDIKTVEWLVEFVNASSAWATGKKIGDYVTVTPQSAGSTTATVKCLLPFGEQIRIRVTSTENALANAECTVDFAKRITSVTQELMNVGGENYTFDVFSDSVTLPISPADSFSGVIPKSFVYTDYTVEDTFTVETSVCANPVELEKYKAAENMNCSASPMPCTSGCEGLFTALDFDVTDIPDDDEAAAYRFLFIVINSLHRWLGQNLDSGLFYFEITITGKYTNYVKQVPVHFTGEGLAIYATDITLDDTDLII